MNGRSGLFTFFIFLFLVLMIVLQILAMIQSDRLYERLNLLLDRLAGTGMRQPTQARSQTGPDSAAPGYPGDEGDWLVYRLRGEPRTLNPISVEGSLEGRTVYMRNIFEPLFYYNLDVEGVELEPVLAESMNISDDGLEIEVKLKQNIWFSDGVPVTADDVKFTYDTIMNPGIDAPNIRNYYANVKEVIKIDQRTVKFVFNELYWKTIEAVGVFDVLPKHIYEFNEPSEFNTRRSNPVGSGPYIFENWKVGSRITLSRNENYWGKKPRINKLIFKIITNDTAALQALRAHDTDYMEPSSEQFAEVAADEDFRKQFHVLSYWQPSGGYAFTAWNNAIPFFSDRRVRLAMTHIINREAIVEHLLKGYGKIVTGSFYIYGRQSDPNIEPWPYDPERAKELLNQAGWIDTDGDGLRDKDGTAFSFRYSYPSSSTTGERIGKLLKDDAQKVGIEVMPDPLEWSIFIERLNERQFQAAMLSWGGTIESDPYQIWHSSQIKGRGNNFAAFNSPEADAVIEQARRTLDEEKRYALYHRFHRILHQQQPYTFLVTIPTFVLLDNRFENVTVHKLGVDPLEWYVPKEKQLYK